MYPSISPSQVRQVVLDRFQRQLTQPLAGGDLEERVRIEDGRVVAYCYRADNLFAMWMVEIGLVQFYDEDGTMLRPFDLLSETPASRHAA